MVLKGERHFALTVSLQMKNLSRTLWDAFDSDFLL
jgi:hypothetical protein